MASLRSTETARFKRYFSGKRTMYTREKFRRQYRSLYARKFHLLDTVHRTVVIHLFFETTVALHFLATYVSQFCSYRLKQNSLSFPFLSPSVLAKLHRFSTVLSRLESFLSSTILKMLIPGCIFRLYFTTIDKFVSCIKHSKDKIIVIDIRSV